MITMPTMFGSFRDRVDNNVFDLTGSGAPTAATGAGIAGPGSTYTDVLTGNRTVNMGTLAAPAWNGLTQQAYGTISAADIVATGAGKFGHAQGYPVVLTPGPHNVIELESLILIYDFIVAAFTAGGNITVNWSAGGAAITGLVSAANSVGAASDKLVMLVPLSTAGIPLVEAAGLNLVTSAAFTQPGTAAGVIRYVVNYRVHATGY